MAVQLVRAWGGSVTTTVSSRAAPLAQMLGAEDVITYDNSNFDKELMLREKFVLIFISFVIFWKLLNFGKHSGELLLLLATEKKVYI